jgi:hypothetical protein
MVDPAIHHPLGPKRRWFLKSALVIGGVGAALGGVVYWRRGLSNGPLTEDGRNVFRGLIAGFVGDMLPADPAQRQAMIEAQLPKAEAFVLSLPQALQVPVSGLLGMLSNGVTRRMLTGLKTDWHSASQQELSDALEAMRLHDLPSTRLIYQTLRSITCMSFFIQSEHWSLAGYPGPVQI